VNADGGGKRRVSVERLARVGADAGILRRYGEWSWWPNR
jgi:hypothetical protein